MSKPQDPEAAETAQTTDSPAVAPAATCSTCRFWVLDKDDGYSEIISPTHPGTYEQIDPTVPGGEAEISALWGHNVRRCRSPKVTFYTRPEKDGATVCDGSGYMAELLTGENFGCIHHCMSNAIVVAPGSAVQKSELENEIDR